MVALPLAAALSLALADAHEQAIPAAAASTKRQLSSNGYQFQAQVLDDAEWSRARYHYADYVSSPNAKPYPLARHGALLVARDAYCTDPASAEATYGPIGDWDVSRIPDMSYLFCADGNRMCQGGSCNPWSYCNPNCSSFDADIGSWNVSNVETMESMFYKAPLYTGRGLGNWITSSVTDMNDMFYYAASFVGDTLGSWDVSKVSNMRYMFLRAHMFAGDALGTWDVSSVENMQGMFWGATTFTGNGIGAWDVSQVRYMTRMFDDCVSFVGHELSGWNVSNVKMMPYMFDGASLFDGEGVINWDVRSVGKSNGHSDFNTMFGQYDPASITDCTKARIHASFSAKSAWWPPTDHNGGWATRNWANYACPPMPPPAPPSPPRPSSPPPPNAPVVAPSRVVVYPGAEVDVRAGGVLIIGGDDAA